MRLQGGDTPLPGGVEIGVRREPAVELKDDHSVRKRPRGSREVKASAGRLIQGTRGPGLASRDQELAIQRPFGHQAIEMGMTSGEIAVGLCDRGQRIVGGVEGPLEQGGLLFEAR